MPKNEGNFFPPNNEAIGRKQKSKGPNPLTEKPLPKRPLNLQNWTMCKPLFQQ
jgi:hypothetical protein